MFGDEGIDVLDGGSSDDDLYGGDGADRLTGGIGSDSLSGGLGDDRLDGGLGVDWASFRFNNDNQLLARAVRVDLSTGIASGWGNDVLRGIENASGSTKADVLVGSSSANQLQGLDGNDRIEGRSGNDTLQGGRGADTLLGGAGRDRFVMDNTEVANADRIIQFSHANDTIYLTGSALGGGNGGLAKDAFLIITGTRAVARAADAEDRVIYMRDTGKLYFDRDGSGTDHRAELFATLAGHPAIDATDFRFTTDF